MKKQISILFLALSMLSLSSQAKNFELKSAVDTRHNSRNSSTTFIGTTGGFKGAYGILGVQVSQNIINPNVYLTGGLGLSFAGIKLGADIQKFSQPNRRGFAFGAGLAYVGRGGKKTQFVDNNTTNNGSNYTYYLTNQGTPLVNLFLGYHFRMGARSTFYIQGGYGIPFQKAYYISGFSGTPDELSAANLGLSLVAPHGLMTGLGFMFGL